MFELSKRCVTCGNEKLISVFNKAKKAKDGLQSSCRDCSRLAGRTWNLNHPGENQKRGEQWRHENPVRRKVAQWLSNGIKLSEEEYLRRLCEQHNSCALCGVPRSFLKVDLAPDHNHKTGKIRGLLCQKCNRGLGHFYDDVTMLQKAIVYLER